MRKHGWQLPYHPLQVVAIAVFLALGVSFYVFFAPFLGGKKLEYLVIGLYTPLISCVTLVYIWCTAANPGDDGILRSKSYLSVVSEELQTSTRRPRFGNGAISSVDERNVSTFKEKNSATEKIVEADSSYSCSLLERCSFKRFHPRGFSGQQTSEDGSFYCSLCKVEVYKYSKHCRICDKCVDGFDHHCRWLNNCVGKKNYLWFFILIVSALLLLILQWSVGLFIMIRCLLNQRECTADIKLMLGSCFSFPAFIIVLGSCSFLALVATLPLAQLFFFHVLLLKKGITTYDYILAMREQEQQAPTLSPASSITGLSSTSSFTHFRRGAWCTTPHLFLEDHGFDVALSEVEGSVRQGIEPGRINPWKLARMNGEDVAKAAAEARKRSRILQPSLKGEIAAGVTEADSSFGSGSSRTKTIPKSWSLPPLSASSRGGGAGSPESSSPGSPPCFRRGGVFSTGVGRVLKGSDSDGYEASGGEDSDRKG